MVHPDGTLHSNVRWDTLQPNTQGVEINLLQERTKKDHGKIGQHTAN
jgi:hypothetical protein